MQFVRKYGVVAGWFRGLVRRKEVSFIVLLLRLGLAGFSRV